MHGFAVPGTAEESLIGHASRTPFVRPPLLCPLRRMTFSIPGWKRSADTYRDPWGRRAIHEIRREESGKLSVVDGKLTEASPTPGTGEKSRTRKRR